MNYELWGYVVSLATFRQYADKIADIPTGGGSGDYKVQFFDPFGVLLKVEYVNEGENATPPTPPTLDLLTFNHWNHPGTNITRDENIGAIYDTTDGKKN